MNKQKKLITIGIVAVLILAIGSVAYFTLFQPAPVIDNISPSYGPVGTEIVVEGSNFTEANDIGFTDYQESEERPWEAAYLTGIESPDGTTLSFVLPDTQETPLASGPLSVADEPIPSIGLELPLTGEVGIFVVNANGESNKVDFAIEEPE